MRAGLLAVLAAAASAAPTPPAPVAPIAPSMPSASVTRVSDGWRADLAFDGRVLGWAAPMPSAGNGSVYVLVGAPAAATEKAKTLCGILPAAASRDPGAPRLYRWDPGRPESLAPLAGDVSAGSLDAVDLDGDGTDELILRRRGEVAILDLAGVPGTVAVGARVTDDAIGAGSPEPTSARVQEGSSDTLRLPLIGALRSYRALPDGALALASEIEVPLRVRPRGAGVQVESLAILPVGRAPSGRMRFATRPEWVDSRRLRVVLLDPDGPAETRSTECWAALPSPERLIESAIGQLDGVPVAIVTTISADRLDLLGEKRLRVFPLLPERTRVGEAPVLAVETGVNLWQVVRPVLLDLDADGREDLILAYWKGLKNTIAALEVHSRRADGSFAPAKTQDFEVDQADRGVLEYGRDFDGDGRPDLLVLAGREALVFAGSGASRAVARPVDPRPRYRIPLPPQAGEAAAIVLSVGPGGFGMSSRPGGYGTPRPVDLDRDGRPELVFAGDVGGEARVSIVRFGAAGGSGVAPRPDPSYN